MSDREVYPNAPLRLVTVEYRFPLSPVLASEDALSRLAEGLGDDLPIVEPAAPTVQLSIGGTAALPAISPEGFRFLSRERTVSVTVQPQRLAIETTAYRHWEDFRDRYVKPALKVTGVDMGAIAGVERVGLRYIDEIRVAIRVEQLEDWRGWVSDDLLAPLGVVRPHGTETMQGRIHIKTGPEEEALLTYGALTGHVVDDTGVLNLPFGAGEGPFFLLDIDSFWTSQRKLDEFDLLTAVDVGDRLHGPVRQLFESCITDRLRNEVLRRSRDTADG